ncbi:hypothetical protein [Vibrio sp. CAU 1672]|uniref:hypothetical protein n=1 Tax=Vibrio sp. CAU 1672 TaxID=3032594 RepID=UPI0023DAA443|nr:hypothetical protein [Vibrio sp. CAU 1672]MDF2153067.1 hypothetical protein [Vibrio sp. CAU 1672]
MKKLLLATAVVVAAGTAGYLYQKSVIQDTSDSLLAQVPADSLMVAYQTEAFNHYEFLNAFGVTSQGSIAELFALQQLTPQQAFVLNLLDGYLESAASPESLKAYFGTGDSINPLFYTLGLVPVYKLPIESPAALWKTLDHQELMNGVTHEKARLGTVEYRRYELTDAADPQNGIGLVVAVVDNVLTITVDVPKLGEQNPLAMAFGLEAPAVSLADTDRLKALQDKYGENNNSFGYVDHREIIKGLTTRDGNLLAQQLSRIEPDPELEQLRSPACHREFTQIGQHWPQSVAFMEYQMGQGQPSVKGSFVIESSNRVILDALKSLRGVLADSNSDESFLSLALGVDITKLAPAIGTIWMDLAAPQYQCPMLAQMQGDMREFNPTASVQLGAGMLNGLKGLGMELFDIYVDSNTAYGESFEQLDALLTVSASDPNTLLQSAQLLVPELAQLPIKPDNQPVNVSGLFNQYSGMSMDVFVRMNDAHLTIYSGEKAGKASEQVMAHPLTPNGLLSFKMDSERILEVMQSTSEVTGEPVPEDVALSLQQGFVGGMTLDVTEDGIAFGIDYQAATGKKAEVAQQ